MTLRAESAILGSGCRSLGALEKHPPGIFVRHVEEPIKSLMLRRVEFPKVEGPSLTREDQPDEHNLDYVDKLELLVHQGLDACLESGQLSFCTPRQACLLPGGEPRRGGGSKLRGCDPFGVAWRDDVKPP